MQYTHLPPKNVDSTITNKTYKSISTTSTTLPIQITIPEDAYVISIRVQINGTTNATTTSYAPSEFLLIKDATNTNLYMQNTLATAFTVVANASTRIQWQYGQFRIHEFRWTSPSIDGVTNNISCSRPFSPIFIPAGTTITFSVADTTLFTISSVLMYITYRTP